MRVTPARLSASIGLLFIIGSACFVVGSVPAYVDAVGTTADAVTFFVGSVFFTSASFCQLVQAQSPAMTGVDEGQQHEHRPVMLRAWLPHDRAWCAAATQFPGTLFFNISTLAALVHYATVQDEDQHVWRPDMFGSTLFLVSSAYAIAALGGRVLRIAVRSVDWWIAWLNMLGSVLFMASALASFVLPSTGDLVAADVATSGTLLGALCFLIGAALVFPSWRHAVARVSTPGLGSGAEP